MKKRDQAHTKMFITTLGVLDKYQVVWQGISAFVTARNALEQNINAIRAEEVRQSARTTGVTQNKRLARRAMCLAAASVAGALASWADTQNNHELFGAMDLTEADLFYKKEEDGLTDCTNIWQSGVANLAAMSAAQTLTQSDLTNLKTKIDAFKTLYTKPRQARSDIKKATDTLPDLVDATDRLCERQLDRLMERFRESNPDFYGAYKVARMVVNFPTIHNLAEILTSAAAATTAPATTISSQSK